MTFYQLTWLFFCYSFLGWFGEVLVSAIRDRRYRDHGVLGGPLCLIYGISGCIITIGLQELAAERRYFYLFLFSAVIATVVEWTGGHILESTTHSRWWDYSHRRYNLDGYICLSSSLLWGLLGVFFTCWGGPFLVHIFDLLPPLLGRVLVWVAVVLFALDTIGTILTLSGVGQAASRIENVHNRLASLTLRLGLWVLRLWERRMLHANPQADLARRKREKSDTFAAGLSFYKLFLLFFIGAFLGDIVETLFCHHLSGEWMSRSSLVWGPFSVVWGLALSLGTWLMYRYRDRSAAWLFVAGTLMGGAYEYLCSVVTEKVFGAVFWDYSALPFNLGGRINLLYCFFWGFAAVIWFKVCLPPISRLIEKLPKRPATLVTWVLVLFMAVDCLLSAAALVRYTARLEGKPPANAAEAWIDTTFDDSYMKRVYPKYVYRG